MHREGVIMPKVTKEIIERADKEGKTDNDIAKECGVSRQAVYQMRKKFGLIKPPKKE